MIPYMKYSSRNLLRPINTFNKGAVYKANTEKLPSLYAIKNTPRKKRGKQDHLQQPQNIFLKQISLRQ